ncbi:MAG: baseplate J/gp47 family protein, partial [Candidatus Scalindua sp.]|nr:baseplate J/gp47 family protein [Candidatus Scalindua sp.]
FLRLFEFASTEMNTLTGRHLDFYYREILRLKEKAPEPGHAHLLVELAKQVNSHEFKKGVLLKAGKDEVGKDAFFANDYDFVANQAKVAELKTVYRHGDEKVGTEQSDKYQGRVYASPVAKSDDGMGAEQTSVDKSWHPFHNKMYLDGALSEINMPKAKIGFAIASHYLLMAGGKRTITLDFTVTGDISKFTDEHQSDVICQLTSEKGWIEGTVLKFKVESNVLKLEVELDGANPAVTPYVAKIHGYNFVTNLPVLLVKLQHRDEFKYIYSDLQDVVVNQIDLAVNVTELKTLAVSNDFGPVDTSKPFQPFGAQPVNGSGFIVGSKEMFQKKLKSASLKIDWQNPPSYYVSKTPNVSSISPSVAVSYLVSGEWSDPNGNNPFITPIYNLITTDADANASVLEAVDFSENEPYSSASRNGYVRLLLQGDLYFKQYQIDLGNYLANRAPKPTTHPGAPILGPSARDVSITYNAKQEIPLDLSLREEREEFEKRIARFFHLTPFGHAEQHQDQNNQVYLFPQFDFQRDNAKQESEAELYIGVTDLKPTQNLALLFQVADGTADPLSKKPDPHIHWSYLCGNEWIPFDKNEVDDKTHGLLNSGIITFAMPRDASDTNTLLPSGMHWLRAAVASKSEAVCRLRLVAAQALKATFTDKGNDPAFPAKVLESGTISKLDQPDAAVKKITQPFVTFGGRGKEEPRAFYTRISERLRHKDRGIALWDYERLILEAFPQIYKAKCLNHMQYEPNESGKGIYRELAPGHVTVVTIPNQQFHKLRDPFRPYTSLRLLDEIKDFLSKRLSRFVKPHVRNPLFEEVWVVCKVRLKDGNDETFSVNKLQEVISSFLSPWAFPGGGSPSFGGKVYKSVLINFVEDQPYVDYVTDFQLLHKFVDLEDKSQTVEKKEVEGSRAVSILVSARKHDITTINRDEAEMPGEKCPCEAT